jgi:hypothetical protein
VLRERARATGQRHNSSHLDQLLGERLRVDVWQQRHGGGPRSLAPLPSQQLTPQLQPAGIAAAVQHPQLQQKRPGQVSGCLQGLGLAPQPTPARVTASVQYSQAAARDAVQRFMCSSVSHASRPRQQLRRDWAHKCQLRAVWWPPQAAKAA